VLLIHIQQGGVFITDLNLKSVSRYVSRYGCAEQISLHQLAICVIRAGHMSETKRESVQQTQSSTEHSEIL
jgi:hypothetical protein